MKEEDFFADNKVFSSSAASGFYSPKKSPENKRENAMEFYHDSPRKMEEHFWTKYLVEKLSGKYQPKENIEKSYENVKV